MIFKRFYKVLLLQQEGNCPQTANVSHIHVLLTAIFGMLRIHSQLKHLRVSRRKYTKTEEWEEWGEETMSHVSNFFCSCSPFFAEQE